MKPFEEIKQEILKRAKKADACQEQYKKAYVSETTEELLKVVKDNLRWAYDNMGVKADFLEEYFGVEILKENHIYTSGEHSIEIKEGKTYIWTLGSSSANVKTLGSSSANVETLDSSSANVETLDSSSANVETWGSSSKLTFKVKGYNSFIRHHNERKIYVKKNNFEIVEID